MPFTGVTLVNGSGSKVDGDVHINPNGSNEDRVFVRAEPGETTNHAHGAANVDFIYGSTLGPGGSPPTSLRLQGGMNDRTIRMFGFPADIAVDVNMHEILDVTIILGPTGDGTLLANILDKNTGAVIVESRPMM